jgi:hypothetical protein
LDFREDRSESSDDLEKSSQDLEKSSPVREEALAVLSVFRQDGFGFAAVIERFRAVRSGFAADRSVAREDLSESIASRKLSLDGGTLSLESVKKPFGDRHEARAVRFSTKSSLG